MHRSYVKAPNFLQHASIHYAKRELRSNIIFNLKPNQTHSNKSNQPVNPKSSLPCPMTIINATSSYPPTSLSDVRISITTTKYARRPRNSNKGGCITADPPICSHSLHSMAVCRHYKQWITPRAAKGVAMGVVLGGFRLKCGAFGTVQHHFSTSLKFCSRKLRGK